MNGVNAITGGNRGRWPSTSEASTFAGQGAKAYTGGNGAPGYRARVLPVARTTMNRAVSTLRTCIARALARPLTARRASWLKPWSAGSLQRQAVPGATRCPAAQDAAAARPALQGGGIPRNVLGSGASYQGDDGASGGIVIDFMS